MPDSMEPYQLDAMIARIEEANARELINSPHAQMKRFSS